MTRAERLKRERATRAIARDARRVLADAPVLVDRYGRTVWCEVCTRQPARALEAKTKEGPKRAVCQRCFSLVATARA